MATATFFVATDLASGFHVWQGDEFTLATSTHVQVETWAYDWDWRLYTFQQDYYGSFSIGNDGIPRSGTITATVNSRDHQELWRISGLSVSWQAFFALADPAQRGPYLLAGADVLNGSFDADYLSGFAGADTVFGNDGRDVLAGGTGDDSLAGGTGDDLLVRDTGNDTLDGGEGNADWLYLEGDVSFAVASPAATRVDLESGTAVSALESDRLLGIECVHGGDAFGDTISGSTAANELWGEGGDDVLSGRAGDDLLYGGTGADTLDGGDGIDTLAGGPGADRYRGAPGDVLVEDIEDDGIDTVESATDATLAPGFENLLLSGSGRAAGTGNAAANRIDGNGAANRLLGADGADTLGGGAGSDTLAGGAGADLLDGGGGDDDYRVDRFDVLQDAGGIDSVRASLRWHLGTGFENLALEGRRDIAGSGNALANRLEGNRGDNALGGGGGADTLAGGAGDDTLAGGSGADLFLFDGALPAAGTDLIADLGGHDRIGLDGAVFTALGEAGTLDRSLFAAGEFDAARDANDRIVFDTRDGTLYYDADGTGGIDAVAFARLAPGTSVTAADFIVL